MYYIESSSNDPKFNLALEEYVFNNLPREHDYFILWQNDNTIVVGKNQNTVQEINQQYVKENDITVVRRLSGGGAVYHDMGNLNFTFIVDAKKDNKLDMKKFCIPVINTLSQIGVKAELTGRNDITIEGKKFSGNSQYIKKGRVMHHGTIMFNSDLSTVSKALQVSKDKIESKGLKSVKSRVTNIKNHLNEEVTINKFMSLLKDNISRENKLSDYSLTQEDIKNIEQIKESRYDTWDWNYGYSPDYKIFKEKRVEGCGKIEIGMDVQKGIIAQISIHGDYFGSDDISHIEDALTGVNLNEKDIKNTLSNFTISNYIHNLNLNEFVDILTS